jgi:Tfp pilus assembly protein PilO
VNPTRIWMIVGALGVVGVLALGWFLGVSPQLDRAAAADAARTGLEQQNVQSAAHLDVLKKQSAQLSALDAKVTSLQQLVPPSPSLASFYSQTAAVAATTGVVVSGISTDEAMLYGTTSTDGAAPASSTPATGASPTPSPTPSAGGAVSGSATATPPPAAPATAGTAPGADIAGRLFVIPTTVTVTGSNDQLRAFLAAAQTDRRIFLVTEFAITPGGASEPPTAVLHGYLFAVHGNTSGAPGSVSDLAGTEVAAAPSATPTPSATPRSGGSTAAPKPSATTK